MRTPPSGVRTAIRLQSRCATGARPCWAGLDAFFRARGLTPAQINACLANRAGIERLTAITRRANALGVQGTPTFLVNGRVVGTVNWARLEPMLTGR